MAETEDIIVHDRRATPQAKALEKAVKEVPELAPVAEAAKSLLERSLAAATNSYQRRLLTEFLDEGKSGLSEALAEAALRKLLQSEDDEIVLKAAKELRSALGPRRQSSVYQADKMQINQGASPEDPRLRDLKDDL